jgi:alpha-D-ribose 1-methylphosphonate 5-triphosphate synthase subunit PhnL
MAEIVCTVDGLTKIFDVHARGTEIRAVRDCGFQVEAGRVTALVGPSGAGKSTVMKCLNRTYLPSAGHIILHRPEERGGDLDLATCDDHDVLDARSNDLGFVTQFLHCLPRKSSLDVVAEPLVQQRVPVEEARSKARRLLTHLGIPEPLWSLPPATFSGGEKQRINIARGFVRPNRLLLLDEPTASLDKRTAELVVELIIEARDAGTGIVAIWHDPLLVERLADQVVHVEPVIATTVA